MRKEVREPRREAEIGGQVERQTGREGGRDCDRKALIIGSAEDFLQKGHFAEITCRCSVWDRLVNSNNLVSSS